MPNFNEPAIREVATTHFLFFEPGRRILWVRRNVLIVIAVANIVHPRVAWSDGVEWVVRADR